MRFIRRFVMFWVDFIIGDAWEVALGIGVALVAIAYIAEQWGGRQGLGFMLLAVVLGVTWLALLRTTANARRALGDDERPQPSGH
jgi:hypothetical protein